MDKFKDIIYETSDLIFGLTVLIFIIVISTYQLHGWFNISMPKNLEQMMPASNTEDVVINSNVETIDDPPVEIAPTKPQEPTDTEEVQTEEPPITMRNIAIAPGSSSDKVANALYENNIINSKQAFITRLIELKSETKIKAGSFSIPSNSSIEEVIKIITQ